jgi:hypothetical protein
VGGGSECRLLAASQNTIALLLCIMLQSIYASIGNTNKVRVNVEVIWTFLTIRKNEIKEKKYYHF